MVSSQSLSTMDAATAEPIWTLEQGGFPDEALKRGREFFVAFRVEFFCCKNRTNWGLFGVDGAIFHHFPGVGVFEEPWIF